MRKGVLLNIMGKVFVPAYVPLHFQPYQLLRRIEFECFIHFGEAFDIQEIPTIGTLIFEWKTNESSAFIKFRNDITYHHTEDLIRFEKMLKQLPKGISYTRTDTLVSKEKSAFIWKTYHTQLVIHVSKAYANAVFSSRINIEGIDKTEELINRAKQFAQVIVKKHPDILKELYQSYNLHQNNCFGNTGSYSYNGTSIGRVSYASFGLKSLDEEYQLLGLAIAVAEYGKPHLKDNEYYGISSCSSFSSISIVKPRPDPNAFLNDW